MRKQRTNVIDHQPRALAQTEQAALAATGREDSRIRAAFNRKRIRVCIARIEAMYGQKTAR